MMPGSTAAAFPANLARTQARDNKAFLTHSFKPPLPEGGAGVGAPPPPPVSASTRVEMVIPSAVNILAKVTPVHETVCEYARRALCPSSGSDG